MSITKHKLSFDPAEADDYDVVASYLRSSDGTLLTHTTNGGKEALDVHIAGSDIQLEVDLVHTEDSVRLGDGTSFFTSTSENGDIALDVHISNSDLDIRDLAFATDSVTAHQGGTWTIDSITNPVTVTATDLDIRDLTHASDSVKVGDGTDFLAIETDGSINTNATIQGFDSCNNPAAVTVTSTATDLLATELSGRKEITIQNVGGKDAYLGCDSGVTSAKGLFLPKGSTATFKFSDSVNVHAITDSGTTEFRILEMA